ncbi:hypothetical protein [Niastella sp. OAS944]|uniref:hypothetical protein n=1 Tax=Niastella sp. OAS944 TaxID=2664089 RepID=UPI0034801BB8|nr:hypothetical protein [Chitinophagaceae bacterium OAS944]
MSRFNQLAGIAVILYLLILSLATNAQTASGTQNRFYAKNVKRIDSFILFLKTYCNSVKPVTITNKSVKQDKENLRYVSKLYNMDMQYKEFVQDADKNDLVQSQNMQAGIIGLKEFKIDENAGYMATDIWLTVIDDKIIYKKFVIKNTAKRKCAVENTTIPFFDFVYLKGLVNDVDFPVYGCANCDSLVVDTLYQSLFNEAEQKYTAYKFMPDVTNRQLKDEIFTATYLQAGSYHNKEADGLFIQLLKLKEYATISSLLYSPNHLMAVNAYEALAYLRSTRAFDINSQLEEKMKSIASSPVEIPVFCGRDCKPTNFPYSTLKITERNIYDKYDAALK